LGSDYATARSFDNIIFFLTIPAATDEISTGTSLHYIKRDDYFNRRYVPTSPSSATGSAAEYVVLQPNFQQLK